MKCCVIITNANMNDIAGNTALIFRRAQGFFDNGVFTYIFVVGIQCDKKSDYYYELSSIKNIENINEIINEQEISFVLFYGMKAMLYYKKVKRLLGNGNEVKMLFDVQGALEEEIEYSSFRRRGLYPLKYLMFLNTINKVDGAFVVSDELIDNCEKKRKRTNDFSYYKIRCGTNSVLDTCEIIQRREKYRMLYEIQNKNVFVFSGARYAWQKTDDIIGFFKEYDKEFDDGFFVFLCDTDDEFKLKLLNSFPKGNYTSGIMKGEDYFNMLCACDVGFIHRDYNETNRVAFPNKVSDYLSAGLLVAFNRAISEPYRLIKEYRIPYIDTDSFSPHKVKNAIENRKESLRSYLDCTRTFCSKELDYSNQVKESCRQLL